MDDELEPDEPIPTPIAWEPPRTAEELQAEERGLRETANSEAAIRGATVVGALGGNVPIGSGGVIGRGGALGIEETEREVALDERTVIDESDDDVR